MDENQKGIAIKEMKNIREIMENVEKKKPKPILWMLWGIITSIAGTSMQILYFIGFPEYSVIVWVILWPFGTVISGVINHKYYKDEPFPLKDPTLKNKPFILLIWICMVSLGLVMTFLLVKEGVFELIWIIWFLIIGVGTIQTGNLFRSYYRHVLIFYFFGVFSFICGILISLVDSLQIWAPLLWHLLLGFCWISEGIRGRKKNKKWI